MGLDYVELGKQTGEMAAKVLKGEAKASELNFETIKAVSYTHLDVYKRQFMTRVCFYIKALKFKVLKC